jgi:hypothetical protein
MAINTVQIPLVLQGSARAKHAADRPDAYEQFGEYERIDSDLSKPTAVSAGLSAGVAERRPTGHRKYYTLLAAELDRVQEGHDAMTHFLEERGLLREFYAQRGGSVNAESVSASPDTDTVTHAKTADAKPCEASSSEDAPTHDDNYFEGELRKIKMASHGIKRVTARMGDSAPPSDAQRRYVFQLGRADGLTTQDIDMLLLKCGTTKSQISKLIDFMIRRQSDGNRKD